MGAADAGDDVLRNSDYVQSLERGLAVIRALDGDQRALALSDVARATGLTRAAARRFLLTLVKIGYVRFDDGRYSLRPRVLELGRSYLAGLQFPEAALPHLEALVAKVQESSSISVLDDTDIVYVARVPMRRIMRVTIAVGTRFPAYATSMGRVLLADLPPAELDERLARSELRRLTSHTVVDWDELRDVLAGVREQGYAIVNQELEEGLCSAAVPLRGDDGAVVAAVNVSVHADRTSVATVRRTIVPSLRATAAAIEADMQQAASRRATVAAGP